VNAQKKRIRTIKESVSQLDSRHQLIDKEFRRQLEISVSDPETNKVIQRGKTILSHYYREDLSAFKQEVEYAFQEIKDSKVAHILFISLTAYIKRTPERSFLEEKIRDISAIRHPALLEEVGSVLQIDTAQLAPANQRKKIAEKWEGVHIEIIDKDVISIRGATGKAKKLHYAEAGFKDGRTNFPVTAWNVLLAMAQYGEISWAASAKDTHLKAIPKAIEVLRKRLRKLIGLAGDPFLPYRKEKAWRPRFILSDRRYGGQGAKNTAHEEATENNHAGAEELIARAARAEGGS
jgi:hypothetical protein